MKRWQCSVCGYIHTGDNPPDKCPVCGADKDQFVLLPPSEPVPETDSPAPAQAASGAQKWRCTVCGYIHNGPEPPEVCPVCGADRSQFEPVLEEPAVESALPEPEPRKPSPPEAAPSDSKGAPASDAPGRTKAMPSRPKPPFVVPPFVAEQLYRNHAHPIMVHIPNGLLPVSVVFAFLAAFFGIRALDTAAFYNQVAVLLSMPLVALTGYSDWQSRFGGYLTQVFKVKLICAAVITALLVIVVLWRMINPLILEPFATGRWLYLLLELALLAAASVAGFYGGKLVFRD